MTPGVRGYREIGIELLACRDAIFLLAAWRDLSLGVCILYLPPYLKTYPHWTLQHARFSVYKTLSESMMSWCTDAYHLRPYASSRPYSRSYCNNYLVLGTWETTFEHSSDEIILLSTSRVTSFTSEFFKKVYELCSRYWRKTFSNSKQRENIHCFNTVACNTWSFDPSSLRNYQNFTFSFLHK